MASFHGEKHAPRSTYLPASLVLPRRECTHRERNLRTYFSEHETISAWWKKDTCCTVRWIAVSGLWDSLSSVKICLSPSSCGCHAIFIVFFNSTTERSQPSLTSQINGNSPRLPPPPRHESIGIPANDNHDSSIAFCQIAPHNTDLIFQNYLVDIKHHFETIYRFCIIHTDGQLNVFEA